MSNQTTQPDTLCTTFGLLRHGQTEWNSLKKIQGSCDSPLTQEGRAQITEWSHTLQKFDWDRIVASDLGRVKETVEIINDRLHLPLLFDQRLREQAWGEWEGLTIPYIKEYFSAELERRVQMGWDFSAPGGETRLAVKNRAEQAGRTLGRHQPTQGLFQTTQHHVGQHLADRVAC